MTEYNGELLKALEQSSENRQSGDSMGSKQMSDGQRKMQEVNLAATG